jgi:hypothetical protein
MDMLLLIWTCVVVCRVIYFAMYNVWMDIYLFFGLFAIWLWAYELCKGLS